MGSDNSGKRGGRLRSALVPTIAVVLLFVAGFVFFVGEVPNQVVSPERRAQAMSSIHNLYEVQKAMLRGNLAGKKTSVTTAAKNGAPKPVASVDHIISVFTSYLYRLHKSFDEVKIGDNPDLSAEEAWTRFADLTSEMLVPLDSEYAPPPIDKTGKTTFLSIASYRDENCPNTITEAFKYAENPDGLFVGLVEQNCYRDCRTGVLEDGSVRDGPPDLDCVKTFCNGEMGKYCDHLRVLRINESESLGPAMARYFASKLWHGESYYMQIDAHSFFVDNWDKELKTMMRQAERPKPILTNYPPPDGWAWQNSIGLRMCDGYFTPPGIEAQIVRLDGSSQMESARPATPRFAPFMAAGFFFTSGSFLVDVPFDPFLPWIFMGEEIMLSGRAFTQGYHIFSPTVNVLAHIYVRKHKPKFWETVGRTFSRPGFHNRLNALVIRRVKNLLEYPECDDELVWPSLLIERKRYGMGHRRTLKQYMDMVGLDQVAKTNKRLEWCHKGQIPPKLLEIEAHEHKALPQ